MSSGTPSLGLLTCVLSVWVSWSVHDALQERVFREPGFHFGFFMAFVLQSTSFILSGLQGGVSSLFAEPSEGHRRAVWPCAEEAEESTPLSRGSAGRSTRLHALCYYLLLSALIAGANGSATAALNYVDMQMKVLFKSSKIVTVMGVGSLFGRLYAPSEYGWAFCHPATASCLELVS